LGYGGVISGPKERRKPKDKFAVTIDLGISPHTWCALVHTGNHRLIGPMPIGSNPLLFGARRRRAVNKTFIILSLEARI
jgi:hypothetical protein